MAAKSSLLLNERDWPIRRNSFIGGATYGNADLIWGKTAIHYVCPSAMIQRVIIETSVYT